MVAESPKHVAKLLQPMHLLQNGVVGEALCVVNHNNLSLAFIRIVDSFYIRDICALFYELRMQRIGSCKHFTFGNHIFFTDEKIALLLPFCRKKIEIFADIMPGCLQHGDARFYKDEQLYGQSNQPSYLGIMLTQKDEHGFIEHMHVAKGCVRGAFAFIMEDVEWEIPVLPPVFQ